MFKFKSIVLIAAFSLLGACSSVQTLTTQNVKTGVINIDGDDSDWKNNLTKFPDQKLSVGSQFDEDYIYVCVKTQDTNLIKKIFALGLNLKFVNDNNSKEGFTIKYPLAGLPNLSNIKTNRPGFMIDEESLKKEAQFKENTVEFSANNSGKKATRSSLADFQKQYQVIVKVKKDKNDFIYEIAIPKEGKLLNVDLSSNKAKSALSVKIETNEITFSGSDGFDGGGPGGEGGPPSGPPPGGFPGSSDLMKEMLTPLELSLKITPNEGITSANKN